MGANSIMVKPMDFQNFIALGKTLRDYWLDASRTPTVSRPPKNSLDQLIPASAETPAED